MNTDENEKEFWRGKQFVMSEPKAKPNLQTQFIAYKSYYGPFHNEPKSTRAMEWEVA